MAMTLDIATRLRDRADALQPLIDLKLNPAISRQRVTARRARIADNMAKEGRKLARVQTALRALADGHEAGTLPLVLRSVKERQVVADILAMEKWPYDQWANLIRGRFERAGLTAANYQEARAALVALAPENVPVGKAAQIHALERALIGRRIPGYFPTPPDVVRMMLDLVEGEPSAILEPSAGKGDIADAALARWPSAQIHVVEIVPELREILKLKDYYNAGEWLAPEHGFAGEPTPTYNFLEIDWQRVPLSYDLAVMNPPFEHFQDTDHVQHAYNFLRWGGQLVSIVSESVFFRKDRKASAFREFLDLLGADVYKVEPGAFYASDRPTGVRCRIIRLKRPVQPDWS